MYRRSSRYKMAAPLITFTKIKQRGVVCFLWEKNMEAKDTHKEMLPMYGEHCLSRQAVHNWVQKFSEGRTSIEDEHRVGPITFRQQPKEFFAAGFQGLVKRWEKCLNLYGDYVEKYICLYVIISIRFFSITICNLLIEFLSYFPKCPIEHLTNSKCSTLLASSWNLSPIC